MNRRNFLKSISKVVAGCAVAPAVTKAKTVGLKPNWETLGCKDCFRGCGQFDICKAELRERINKLRPKGLSAQDICNEALEKIKKQNEGRIFNTYSSSGSSLDLCYTIFLPEGTRTRTIKIPGNVRIERINGFNP